ncbi:uncharacterized protein N7482_005542 [Penicillium canariense]|uniref:Uncharacterized protein n=1 Tax=Penicillium canariense TaxID=189055 RepID=A0A9W9I2Q9_9EURO|nr:uncharacterized protein N7482_005542 [Penicillium canariense]KAJ5166761.1 hypothetical protein N7482_005542 [Penicillium canariense]
MQTQVEFVPIDATCIDSTTRIGCIATVARSLATQGTVGAREKGELVAGEQAGSTHRVARTVKWRRRVLKLKPPMLVANAQVDCAGKNRGHKLKGFRRMVESTADLAVRRYGGNYGGVAGPGRQ